MWRVDSLRAGVIFHRTWASSVEKAHKSLPALRFGVFEVDLQAGELRRSGVRVRVQDQPFQVLAALLEHPGQLITREELRQRIWPADTYVDFERGLNKAVNRLREALGDPADCPKFIETLPRRGYRIIAPVERRINSIAILPLENLSGDPAREYWADGLTDELITHVAKIVDLRVISRTSAMRFKHSPKSPAEIGRELAVDALVEGSVVLSDSRVRIRVQLVDLSCDRHLWADSYERELGDIVTLQVEIAQAIARQIRARLTTKEKARVAKTVNPEAYDAYLRGRFFWARRTEEGMEKSFGCFMEAIRLDPTYAAAHAGLADSYLMLGIFGMRSPHDSCPKARAAAERALQLDDTIAEAHTSLAAVRNLYEWNWPGSEQEFRRALELNPNYAVAHQWYATLLSCLGRHEEALREALCARELDPLSLVINAFVGFIHMRARRYDQAVAACTRAVDLDPSNPFGHWILARSLDAADQIREALAQSEEAVRLSANRCPYTAHLGYEYARAGDSHRASAVLHELRERSRTEYVSPYYFALIHIGLNQSDLAFEWLEKAYGERTARLTGELFERLFDPFRSDPRFQDLVRRIGLLL
jgi:TolB-like protein/Tfp pilus assembly protein PilF